jgi:hypothetical protein
MKGMALAMALAMPLTAAVATETVLGRAPAIELDATETTVGSECHTAPRRAQTRYRLSAWR